jgi:hypothetical protein
MDPNFAETYFWEERVYESKGMGPEAVTAVRRLVDLKEWRQQQGRDPITDMRSYWQRRLQSDLRSQENHWRFFVAESWAQLGDKDQAFTWLEKVVEERSYWAIYIEVVPTLDPLRADPRFAQLTKRIGLGQK